MRMASDSLIWVCRLLSDAGLDKSNGEARRRIKQSGVKIDGGKVTDYEQEIPPQGSLVVQVGKQRFVRVDFS